MKKLIFLFLTLMTLQTATAETFKDFVTAVGTVDGTSPSSCNVVRFRVQEFVKRSKESDELLEWYSPIAQTQSQREALWNVIRRMPFFLDDELYEYLYVYHTWRVSREQLEMLKSATQVKTVFSSSKFGWSDPFNGTLPPSVNLKFGDGTVTLRQQLSSVQFCMSDPKIELKIQTESGDFVFEGENVTDDVDNQIIPGLRCSGSCQSLPGDHA